MFFKKTYCIILIFLVLNSSKIFSSPVCEGAFTGAKRHLSSLWMSPFLSWVSSSLQKRGFLFSEWERPPSFLSSSQMSSSPHRWGSSTGMNYRQLLTRLAQSSLGVDYLSSQQIKALENYYSVVRGGLGPDGIFARASIYTLGQRRKIIRYLESNGFSREQIRTLIEDGVVEFNRINPPINRRKVLKHLEDGKPVFIKEQYKGTDMFIRERYLEGKLMKVIKVLEKTDEGLLVEVEGVNQYGKLFKKVIKVNPERTILNPEIEITFNALKSTRKTIKNSDLNLPPPRNEEARLIEQGFKAKFSAGIDKVYEWAAVRRKLQELEANPYITHIEYFGEQMPDHLKYIRKGIEDSYALKESVRLKKLEILRELEEEAKDVVANEGATYVWWLNLNNRLTQLMSDNVNNIHDVNDISFLHNRIEGFPLNIIFPTIMAENFGVMAFNLASSEGIHPAGLLNRPLAHVDNQPHTAEEFYSHDFLHANESGNMIFWGYSMGERLFHKRLLSHIESLPPKKRKQAEVVYFLMVHESQVNRSIQEGARTVSKDVNISNAFWGPQEMRKAVHSAMVGDISGLFGFPDHYEVRDKKLKEFTDVFMEVYNQALQHL